MNAVGIIAEYNPFHNGHLYHLEKIKEMFPNDIIVLVLSGHFMQRGETSIINKWDKTTIALHYGVDLVIELPFPFASQSADIFAKGSIQILNALGVKTIVFGSESGDVHTLKKLADIQLNSNEYQQLIKQYLDEGLNYPTALSKSLLKLTTTTINTPNDILGISYIREIIRQHADIEAIAIKRTNDYHSTELNNEIASASSIREALKNNKVIQEFVPGETSKHLNNYLFFIDDYFSYLKYQIMININNLDKFQTVDEGIENRIKKCIIEASSLEDLIMKIKTKRYTYNKLRRMFTHILCNFTKEEASKFSDISYIRVLGFNSKGQHFLNTVKKESKLPIITKFSKNNNDPMLELELRTTCVYASILDETNKRVLIEKEYRNGPIIKNNL